MNSTFLYLDQNFQAISYQQLANSVRLPLHHTDLNLYTNPERKAIAKNGICTTIPKHDSKHRKR